MNAQKQQTAKTRQPLDVVEFALRRLQREIHWELAKRKLKSKTNPSEGK